MKKVLSVVLVLLLLISFACPVSALSFSSENELSAVELSIKRFNARIKGKSKIELADEILSELGISERYIQNIPVGKKEALHLLAKFIQKPNMVNVMKTERKY